VLRGTQAMLGLALPIALALIFRGRTFIFLCMGPQYGQVSETVLCILMISLFFAMANATAGAIMMAIDKHCEMGGLRGLAEPREQYSPRQDDRCVRGRLGTSLSMAFVHLTFWPRYVHMVLGLFPRTYMWEGWAKASLCSLPFALVCYMADHYWHPPSLAVFFVQILITMPVYAVCVLILFRNEARSLFLKWQASRLVQVV
jgi:hypothetical protein